MIWDKYVALKLLPFAVFGICMSEFVFDGISFSSVFLIPIVAVLVFLSRNRTRIAKVIFAVAVLTIIALLGFSRQSSERVRQSQLPLFSGASSSIVRVVSDAQQKAKSNAYHVQILQIDRDSNWVEVNQIAVLYVAADSSEGERYRYGDFLYVRGEWDELAQPLNPNAFDYKQYMARKGIYLSQFQYPANIHLIDSGYVHPILASVRSFRQYFQNTLIENGFEGDAFGVAKAVITGDKASVTPDLLGKYSASGSMHVLAVSGLHVGIIYMVFFYLLKPVAKIRRGAIIRLVILVLILWFYALFTGMSASVVRASTMFTAVAFAQSVKRITNIYNTIALSALVLLCIRPNLLFEVGFQLSYSAVLGIVSFQPLFESWWTPRSKVGKWIVGLLGVSIAAQLATFPIALGVFNQFPNLFLLSNLWVIPMITIVLYIGVTLILLNTFLPVPHIFYKIWRWVIELMNWGVDRIEAIPYSSTAPVWISIPEIFGVYAIVIGLYVWLKWRGMRALIWMIAGFSLLFGYRLSHLPKDNDVTFYSLKEGIAMDIQVGNDRTYLYTDSIYQTEEYTFQIRGNHLASECRIIPIPIGSNDTVRRQGIYYCDGILVCRDRVFQWWRGRDLDIPTDVVILDKESGFIDLDEIPVHRWKKVILSGELSRGKGRWLENKLEEKGVDVINLSDGYCTLPVN